MVMNILLADIRGFSNMMNMVKLDDVLDFLDEFYSVVTKAVYKNGGNIDKFIGDEVMAFFGAPKKLQNSGENALNTAREMMASLDSLKEIFSKVSPYFEHLGIGLGVNIGEVFIGNVKKYTYSNVSLLL